MTNLLEKILAAFEGSATSSRVGDGDDEDDLGKKLDELVDIAKGLKKEIAEMKTDQKAIQVSRET